jgi:hypothetical protein
MDERITAMQESHNQTHALKVWPQFWDDLEAERKTFEIRRDDRGGFHVGDILFLYEWDPVTEKYTGRQTSRVITYVLTGGQFGLAEGYVAMAIET